MSGVDKSRETVREDRSQRATVRESPRDRATVRESAAAPVAGDGARDRATVREAPASATASRRYRLPAALEERYEYVRDIDAGSQAAVVLCRERDGDEFVAVKLYFVSAVDREAIDALRSADPKHILPARLERGEGMEWEVMEYLPHGSIGNVIEQQRGRPHEEAFVRTFLVEMTDALDHLHELGVTHRDLKPGNVLIRSVDPLDVVLADFGVSVKAGGTALATVAGTYAYAAPESLNNKPSPKGDWWALGVMVHELLTGHHVLARAGGELPSDNEMRARIFEGAFDVDDIADDRWRMLVLGLLTRDRAARWGGQAVREWLGGGSPKVVSAPVAPAFAPQISFSFAGTAYTDPAALTHALAERWDEAAAALRGRKPGELADFLIDAGMADAAAKRIVASGDAARITFAMQRVFTPDEPPTFRGRPVTSDGLAAVSVAAQGDDEDASAWITAFREERALTALSKWENDANVLGSADDRLAGWWSELRSFSNAWTSTPELAARLPRLFAQWEGALLACALDDDTARGLRAAAVDEARRAGEIPGWATGLRQRVQQLDANKAAGTGLAVAALALLPAARAVETSRLEALASAEQARRDEAERAERERRRAEVTAMRRTRRRETGLEFARRLWLVVIFAALAAVGSGFPSFVPEAMLVAAAFAGGAALAVSFAVFLWESQVRRVRLLARTKIQIAAVVAAAALWFVQAASRGLTAPTPASWWPVVPVLLLVVFALIVVLDAAFTPSPDGDLSSQIGPNALSTIEPPRRLRLLARWSVVPVVLTGAAVVGHAISLTPIPLQSDVLTPMRNDLTGLAEVIDAVDAAIPLPLAGSGGLTASILVFALGLALTTLYRDIARRSETAAALTLSGAMGLGLVVSLAAPWVLIAPLAIGLAGVAGLVIALIAILIIGSMS